MLYLNADTRRVVVTLEEAGGAQVTPVSWNWVIAVAEDQGIDTEAVYADGGDLAILAAYNRQVAR